MDYFYTYIKFLFHGFNMLGEPTLEAPPSCCKASSDGGEAFPAAASELFSECDVLLSYSEGYSVSEFPPLKKGKAKLV